MKISSRFERSLCGAILSPRRAQWLRFHGAANDSRTVHGGGQWRSRRRQQQQGVGSARRPSVSRHQSAESDFFTPWIPPPVLVTALPYTSRARDATLTRSTTTPITKRWGHSSGGQEARQEAAGEDKKDNALPGAFFQNKQEMLALVDQVQQGTLDDYINFQRDPYMRGYAPADGPVVTVSERVDDENFPDFDDVRGGDIRIQQTIAKLWKAINRRLANPFQTDIDVVYNLYQKLPDPRMPYLHAKIRHKLMKVLGREDKNRSSMLRYFAVLADIEQAGLRLTRPEWNAAMSFAARWVGHSQDREIAEAMRLWKEMEADSGIKSDAMTFNILFDVASKAGNFVLAEMLYREMERRKLPWNRYHHVSLIHFFGLKMDSDGIRAAYKDMVEAGEMIDTVVLNCVIAGFLRCGEEYAAERVYERMKTAHKRAPAMPYRNYMKDGVITKVLMMFAKLSKASAQEHHDKRENEGDAKVALQHDLALKAENSPKNDLSDRLGSESAIDSRSDGRGTHDYDSDAKADAEVNTDTQDGGKGDGQGGSQGTGDGGALRRHFQKQSPIIPDIQTYRILLNHYAVRFAALDKVAHFLDDMNRFQVPLHGAVFLALFKGFALYGGPGQQWSCERLNTVYGAFQAALAENVNGMYMDVWMARWILRAFRQCDTEDRLWEVWEELKPQCEADFDPDDVGPFEKFLIKLLHPNKQHHTFSDTGMFGEVDPGRAGRTGRGWRG
ncbi:unnamed protein product [Discula destructiva]